VIVNDLEKRGLVRRDPEPTDRRAKIVSLTTEGKRALRAVEGVTERAPPSFDALTAEDVAHLLRIAERLKDG
jgi:DNA-binding MarR family transcriptional regulator